MLLSAKVKNSFSLSRDIPLHILNTSMRSCLFRLSSSVYVYTNFDDSSLSRDMIRIPKISNGGHMKFSGTHKKS